VPLDKLDATAAPTVDDDTTEGYSVRSIWADVTNNKAYLLLDATEGAAVWKEITVAADTGSGAIAGLTVIGRGTAALGEETATITWENTPASAPLRFFAIVQPRDVSADGIITGVVDDTSVDTSGCDVILSTGSTSDAVDVLVFVTELS